MWEKGDKQGAFAAYQKTFALPSPPTEAYRDFGKILQKEYNLKRLINFYTEGLELPYTKVLQYLDFLEVKDYEKIGEIFENKKETAKLWTTYLIGIQHHPSAKSLYLKLIKLFLKTVETLNNKFNRHFKLKQTNSDQKTKKLNSHSLQNEEIWNLINSPNLMIKQNTTKTENKKLVKSLIVNCNYTIINLDNITDLQRNELKLLGIETNYLKQNQYSELIKSKQKNSSSHDNKPLVAVEADQRNQFQLSSIINQYFSAICPYTGKDLSSNQSLLVLPQGYNSWIFYRFVSQKNVFYIATGKPDSGFPKSFIYFPKEEIAIILFDQFNEKDIKEAIELFKRSVFKNWNDIKKYLNNSLHKQVIIPISFWHFAHHYWNELTGIYKLYDNDVLEQVDKFLVGTEHYGEIKDIFPEIPENKIDKISSKYLNKEILKNNYFALRVGSNFITEDLANRIYKVSRQQATPQFLSEIESIKKKHFPLLLVTIRLDTRVWISQINGIVNIVKKLAEDFPKIGLVIDGFSLPCGLVGLSWYWAQKCIEKETQASLEIRSLLPAEIPVYDIVGSTLYENVIWNHVIDLYLAQHGSAQHKIGWIANKPGVIHTNKSTFSAPHLLSVTTTAKENSIEPILIPEEHIIALEEIHKPNKNDKRKNLENYDCNWEIMYNELFKLIQKINN
ncbi:hypothetical protein [Crocosphaera subtropica]|uniref:hypothetical protein n=1 Tax=Crocosphaera subtropica TaxID=2546360 RepID=UPI001FAF6BB0|nr:hypothetical protein [Crocosphaera subtropica]